MALALFDLDNTLIAGDSDHLWGEYLIDRQLVDSERHKLQNDYYYTQYQAGTLDILEYLEFALNPIAGMTPEAVRELQRAFMTNYVETILLDAAFDLVAFHRHRGDTLVIITATNAVVTRPIADRLGIEHLIACDAEIVDGHYTGKPTGTPSFAEGKVTRINEWRASYSKTFETTYFYSDTHNDLPLLKQVDHPTAVDPDEKLAMHATKAGWPIISLRSD